MSGGSLAFLPRVFFIAAALTLASAASAQVYRCGNNYSSTPCSGGREVDTSPPVSSLAGGGGATTVYLCKNYGGGMFWARAHCNTQNALVERIESVPANMPWEQQVEMAQSQRDRGQALAAPSTQSAQQTSTAPTRSSQCASLAARINYLDQLARAGGTASYMDWVAGEKKVTRDQQFRLRC